MADERLQQASIGACVTTQLGCGLGHRTLNDDGGAVIERVRQRRWRRDQLQAQRPQVGVLQSANFSSLHPGYFVVFSGIYGAKSQADAALATARAGGFAGAYSRQISR